MRSSTQNTELFKSSEVTGSIGTGWQLKTGEGQGTGSIFPGQETCERVCKPRAGRQPRRRNRPFTETLRGRKRVLGWGLGEAALTVPRFIFCDAPQW